MKKLTRIFLSLLLVVSMFAGTVVLAEEHILGPDGKELDMSRPHKLANLLEGKLNEWRVRVVIPIKDGSLTPGSPQEEPTSPVLPLPDDFPELPTRPDRPPHDERPTVPPTPPEIKKRDLEAEDMELMNRLTEAETPMPGAVATRQTATTIELLVEDSFSELVELTNTIPLNVTFGEVEVDPVNRKITWSFNVPDIPKGTTSVVMEYSVKLNHQGYLNLTGEHLLTLILPMDEHAAVMTPVVNDQPKPEARSYINQPRIMPAAIRLENQTETDMEAEILKVDGTHLAYVKVPSGEYRFFTEVNDSTQNYRVINRLDPPVEGKKGVAELVTDTPFTRDPATNSADSFTLVPNEGDDIECIANWDAFALIYLGLSDGVEDPKKPIEPDKIEVCYYLEDAEGEWELDHCVETPDGKITHPDSKPDYNCWTLEAEEVCRPKEDKVDEDTNFYAKRKTENPKACYYVEKSADEWELISCEESDEGKITHPEKRPGYDCWTLFDETACRPVNETIDKDTNFYAKKEQPKACYYIEDENGNWTLDHCVTTEDGKVQHPDKPGYDCWTKENEASCRPKEETIGEDTNFYAKKKHPEACYYLEDKNGNWVLDHCVVAKNGKLKHPDEQEGYDCWTKENEANCRPKEETIEDNTNFYAKRKTHILVCFFEKDGFDEWQQTSCTSTRTGIFKYPWPKLTDKPNREFTHWRFEDGQGRFNPAETGQVAKDTNFYASYSGAYQPIVPQKPIQALPQSDEITVKIKFLVPTGVTVPNSVNAMVEGQTYDFNTVNDYTRRIPVKTREHVLYAPDAIEGYTVRTLDQIKEHAYLEFTYVLTEEPINIPATGEASTIVVVVVCLLSAALLSGVSVYLHKKNKAEKDKERDIVLPKK